MLRGSAWEVVVIGAGIAGQLAALQAARRGQRVVVLSKTEPLRTHSRNPRGVNLSIAPGDSWRRQADDIWNDSHFLSDWSAVEAVCQEGPEIVLKEFGDLLDRDEDGQIVAHDYAGTPRGVMSGNYAGLNFLRKLYAELLERGVPVLADRVATSLVLDGGRCVGVVAFNLLTGEIEGYAAPSVVLCTGGFGYIYQNTAHGRDNAGDGHALAYGAGAALKDMEFLYFHHTNVYGTPLIITEGAYSQGLHLFNRHNERFLARYDPSAMEGTERYYLKRYMALELDAGGGVEGKYLLADYTHLGQEYITRQFPRTRKACLDALGLDITRDRIPVVPGVQATLGGIQIDLNGATGVPGLYAAGECACAGVHGADWRVGNPMLAALVFGCRAGTSAASAADGSRRGDAAALDGPVERAVAEEGGRLETIASGGDGEPYHLLRGELRRMMTENVAMLRDAQKLEEALTLIRDLKSRYARASILYRGLQFNEQLVEYLELGSMILMAEAVATTALARTETRGMHWRRDFPDRDDVGWQVHSHISYGPNGPELRHVPVEVGEFRPRADVVIR